MSLLRPAHIPCKEVVELVTDYLEGALPRSERRRVDYHLARCPLCTTYLAQMRETLRLTGRLVPEDLSPEMQREFEDLYRKVESEKRRP